MSETFVTSGGSRAAVLRIEFDRAFADPAQLDMPPTEDLLTIRIGDDVFVIRLSEISGLYLGRKMTRVPGGDPALLGIAGFRGTIQPVYSIATLLGRPTGAAPRWLVVAVAAPIALAFDGFERHSRVASETIRPCDADAKDPPYARDFVAIQQFLRPILHLTTIFDAIRTRRQAFSPTED